MSDQLPSVSVVIPALNAAETVGGQLAALAGQLIERRWEIVLVDNGSTDGTGELAMNAATHPLCEIRVVREPRRGLNVARNTGVRESRFDIIAICDADDVVSPNWLAGLVDGLGTHDIVCGSLEVRSINSAETLGLRGWDGTDTPMPSIGRELGFLDQVICGNVAFKRPVWTDVGGFDENFGRGGDDVDFGWRVQLSGFTVGYRPEAVLSYRARTDRKSLFRQYVRDGEGAAHLYRLYRDRGMPPRHLADSFRTMAWVIRRLPRLSRQEMPVQGQVIRVAGKQWGRIKGSCRHRVLYV